MQTLTRVDLGEVAAAASNSSLTSRLPASTSTSGWRARRRRRRSRALHQVVVNLLTNALKFTPSGGATRLEVEARSGLTLVAELVRAHRGTLTVDSEVGRGTRIVVTLQSA